MFSSYLYRHPYAGFGFWFLSLGILPSRRSRQVELTQRSASDGISDANGGGKASRLFLGCLRPRKLVSGFTPHGLILRGNLTVANRLYGNRALAPRCYYFRAGVNLNGPTPSRDWGETNEIRKPVKRDKL